VVVALIVVALVVTVAMRGQQMKKLAHEGVVLAGKVIERRRAGTGKAGRAHAFIRYEYFPPGGHRFEHRSAVSEGVFAQYQEGAAIDIVYLPSKPSVSSPKFLVDASRQALKLPPL
jgi:hypothetical protein